MGLRLMVFLGLCGFSAVVCGQLPITGTVENGSGVVPNAELQLRRSGRTVALSHTDSEGRFSLSGWNAGDTLVAVDSLLQTDRLLLSESSPLQPLEMLLGIEANLGSSSGGVEIRYGRAYVPYCGGHQTHLYCGGYGRGIKLITPKMLPLTNIEVAFNQEAIFQVVSNPSAQARTICVTGTYDQNIYTPDRHFFYQLGVYTHGVGLNNAERRIYESR